MPLDETAQIPTSKTITTSTTSAPNLNPPYGPRVVYEHVSVDQSEDFDLPRISPTSDGVL